MTRDASEPRPGSSPQDGRLSPPRGPSQSPGSRSPLERVVRGREDNPSMRSSRGCRRACPPDSPRELWLRRHDAVFIRSGLHQASAPRPVFSGCRSPVWGWLTLLSPSPLPRESPLGLALLRAVTASHSTSPPHQPEGAELASCSHVLRGKGHCLIQLGPQQTVTQARKGLPHRSSFRSRGTRAEGGGSGESPARAARGAVPGADLRRGCSSASRAPHPPRSTRYPTSVLPSPSSLSRPLASSNSHL